MTYNGNGGSHNTQPFNQEKPPPPTCMSFCSSLRSTDARTYLAVVGTAVLGHGTLAVDQEAVPAALLGQGRLVAVSDEGVQLSLLAADGLHKLKGTERSTVNPVESFLSYLLPAEHHNYLVVLLHSSCVCT